MNLNKYIIENYEKLETIIENDEYRDQLDIQFKKYMCNRCFYQTNDYDFLVEHLYSNCKLLNGNNKNIYIRYITVSK